MKTIGYIILIIFCALLVGSVLGQPVCGFDPIHRSLQNTASLRKKLLFNEEKISSLIQQRRSLHQPQRRGNIITYIPVVVHVLHTGGSVGSLYNPPDSRIHEAIAYLNAVYGGTHPSLTPAGTDAAGDIGIRFVLAQRDPDCNPTNGIHRVDMTANTTYVSSGVSSNDYTEDVALKTPIAWDQKRYYNIYVVNKINGQDGTSGQFIAGYAYFPTDDIVDGTVMLATQMKAESKTLSHEIGHAFNLYHPFEGSANRNLCPSGLGDRVDDTDPITYNATTTGVVSFACRTGTNKCKTGAVFNIRTESNFMNYTNCYTLFTPGQKERMQASLELAERSSLVTSTALLRPDETPVCAPKINFEKPAVSLNVIRDEVSGCRAYKDYSFYLTIGNSPTQQATVTIHSAPASDAIEGVDFDFPDGNNVIFPADELDRKPFVLRVYDNGSSDAFKKLLLDFTVNSNGGNAIKGSASPQMNIRLKTIDHSPVVPGASGTGAVGVYNYIMNNAKTFDASTRRQKTQILYRKQELNAAGIQAGLLKSVGFYIQKQSGRAFKNLHIKMAQTNVPTLVQDGTITAASSMLDVLSLPAYETTDGWNDFLLQTPFVWDGNSNVAIEICFDNETAVSDNADIIRAYGDGSAATDGNMIVEEDIDCATGYSSIIYYQGGIKPVAKFDYELTGNPVRSSLVTSKSEYLGPYSEIYFYDNSSPKRILGKIKNLGDWNYGCTNIKVDRAGNNTIPFWNNTTAQYLTKKTFFVTPEFNNPEGNFEITLYYSEAEKTGYENATGNDWNNIKIVKTKIPVSEITPSAPQGDKVEVNGVVDHGVYGEAQTIKASFNSGFSGFSAGIINAVLPVTWLSFDAMLVNDDVQLNWSTATEMNNRLFEVEISTNGIDYHLLTTVHSRGNSLIPTAYEYLHERPAQRELFYRLRQVDNDGVFSYSNVVRVVMGERSSRTFLFPVPAGNYVNIQFGTPALNVAIELFSSDMKLLHAEKTKGIVSARQLSLASLPGGTYFVRLTTGKNSEVLRFVKY